MPNFTKGKWKAFYGEKFHGIHVAHADDEQGHDYGNGQIIAHVVRWHDGHSWANARLIAAAPEMYELLADILSGYAFTFDNNGVFRLSDEFRNNLHQLMSIIEGGQD